MHYEKRLPGRAYRGNEKRKLTLHLFLQIIGKMRIGRTSRKNHWCYITEYVTTKGLSTEPIPYEDGLERFTITLNLLKNVLEFQSTKGECSTFELQEGPPVADFYHQLTKILSAHKVPYSILDDPFDLGIGKKFQQMTEYHHYEKGYVRSLWRTLLWVYAVFKAFSSGRGNIGQMGYRGFSSSNTG